MSSASKEQVVHFLSDLYAVELQALAQLEKAPSLAGDASLASGFQRHYRETEQQAEAVRERLEALGGSPSAIKDGIMKLGGKGFLLFAKLQPETPGRLLAHAYSYEAMEWAAYSMLILLANRVDDSATAAMARIIQAEERSMMNLLENTYDPIVRVSHRDTPSEDLQNQLCKHLTEIHAIEQQSLKLTEKSASLAGDARLKEIYERHFRETQNQLASIEDRLAALDSSPSLLKDAALKLGALNWGLFFQAQSDTPRKLAIFSFAVEHLEMASYELLRRVAQLAGDARTDALCRQILAEEGSMAESLAQNFECSLDAAS